MHVITALRDYMGMSQMELAKQANITQCDLSEIETMEPYGSIAKYERLSKVLGVPVDTLVRNDSQILFWHFRDLLWLPPT